MMHMNHYLLFIVRILFFEALNLRSFDSNTRKQLLNYEYFFSLEGGGGLVFGFPEISKSITFLQTFKNHLYTLETSNWKNNHISFGAFHNFLGGLDVQIDNSF